MQICNKCLMEANGTPAHIGRFHQNCEGRTKGDGSPRDKGGRWSDGWTPEMLAIKSNREFQEAQRTSTT